MFDPEQDDTLVIYGDAECSLDNLPSNTFQLIYIDPPFNTGKKRHKDTLRVRRSPEGTRIGFKGNHYSTVITDSKSYLDYFEDYIGFLRPKLEASRKLLRDDGSIYIHLDFREAHYCKVLLDSIFGRQNFINEIIWAYDYGGRSKNKWPAKHDTILFYAKNGHAYYFDQEAVDRIPYMAPGLVTKEKALRGKCPTDVWWHTIVPTNSREKTGYPTQKPEGILRRIIQASTRRRAWVLDFFAGSGTTGAVAQKLGRRTVLIDSNPEAIQIMWRRLDRSKTRFVDSNGRPVVGGPLEAQENLL